MKSSIISEFTFVHIVPWDGPGSFDLDWIWGKEISYWLSTCSLEANEVGASSEHFGSLSPRPLNPTMEAHGCKKGGGIPGLSWHL